MSEDEKKFVLPVGQDVIRDITDADLVRDTKKIVEQALQYYLPGEVEITVLMAFPGQNRAVAVTTSIQEGERLRWTYDTARKQIPLLALRKPGKLG